MDVILGVFHGVLQGDGYSIIFALLCIIIILALFRAAYALVMVALLGCIILVSVLEYTPQEILYVVESQTEKLKNQAIKAATPLLLEGLGNAEVTYEGNEYTVTANGIKIVAKKGDTQILLYFRGEKLTLDYEEFPEEIQEALKDFAKGVPLSGDN